MLVAASVSSPSIGSRAAAAPSLVTNRWFVDTMRTVKTDEEKAKQNPKRPKFDNEFNYFHTFQHMVAGSKFQGGSPCYS